MREQFVVTVDPDGDTTVRRWRFIEGQRAVHALLFQGWVPPEGEPDVQAWAALLHVMSMRRGGVEVEDLLSAWDA